MDKLVKKVLEACFELTENEEKTFLKITGRPQELSITYMEDVGIPVTVGKVKIEDGRIFSNYKVPAQMGVFATPPKSHFWFVDYLREHTGEVIEDEFAYSQYLQNKKKKLEQDKGWIGL